MPWGLILGVGGSLVGGYLAGQGGQAAADATKDAANQSAALQREIYTDQRQLARPSYLTGGAAANKLAAMFGIAPQDYAAAYGGSGGSMGGFGNPYGQSDQWSAYGQANPDVVQYWMGNDKLRGLYPNLNDFLQYHYANWGQRENRNFGDWQDPTQGGNTQSTMPVGGMQEAGSGGTGNALSEF